uniref:Myh8 protein n=1 Tax=Fopius arisanus TaxID=64838 RepID=A0A0C9R5P6_9HYME
MDANAREIERDKQEFTDAINHCIDLLRANNYITDVNSDVITRKAAVIGQEMYECLKKIKERSRTVAKPTVIDKSERVPIVDIHERDHIVRNHVVNHVVNPVNQIHYIKEEPLEIIETEETESYEDEGEKKITVRDVKSLEDSDDFDIKRPGSVSDDDDPIQNHQIHRTRFARGRKRKRPYARIPIEEKIKVVNLARSNPNWTLAWLKERSGSERLSSIIQLRQWEKQVLSKSTIIDKLNVINGWVYSRYLEEKEKNFDVANSMLREWAIAAAQKFVYPRFKFEPNDAWLAGFKKIHGLKHGDIYED